MKYCSKLDKYCVMILCNFCLLASNLFCFFFSKYCPKLDNALLLQEFLC
jgi:hypothetical protein